MRCFQLCLLSLCLTGVASAQAGISEARSSALSNSIFQQLFVLDQDQTKAQAQNKTMQEAASRYQRYLFYGKAKRFVDLWSKMTRQLNQNTVDIKLARQVSKAFHDLEKSDGWPAGSGH